MSSNPFFMTVSFFHAEHERDPKSLRIPIEFDARTFADALSDEQVEFVIEALHQTVARRQKDRRGVEVYVKDMPLTVLSSELAICATQSPGNGKIQAIKAFRNRTGADLVTCRDALEAACAKRRPACSNSLCRSRIQEC